MRAPFEQLSPREYQVAALVAKGHANKEIARNLDPRIGEATVKEYLRRIFQKTRVQSRTELAALWHTHNTRPGGP